MGHSHWGRLRPDITTVTYGSRVGMLGGLQNGYHCKAGCCMSSFTVHCHMAWDFGGFPCNEKHLGTPVTEQHLLKNHIYDPCVNGVFTYSQPVTVDLRPYLAVLSQPSHMPTALLKPISFTGQTIRDRRLQNNSYSTNPGEKQQRSVAQQPGCNTT